MKAQRVIVPASTLFLSVTLLVGCCTPHAKRSDPSFPVAGSPEKRYNVYVGDKHFVVDSVRFERDWLILEGGYPGSKAIWIRRDRVDWIDVPK